MKTNILKVVYFSQNDNEAWGGVSGAVQCCPTANAMLAAYLKPELIEEAGSLGFVEFESFYKAQFEVCGFGPADRGNHDAHTATLEALGILSEWRTDLSFGDIEREIDRKMPVVAGMDYGTAGHITLIVGYDPDGLIIHDPNGIRLGSADRYGSYDGAYDFYSRETLQAIYFNPLGWGRIVRSVEGNDGLELD